MLEVEPTGQSGRTTTASGPTEREHIVSPLSGC